MKNPKKKINNLKRGQALRFQGDLVPVIVCLVKVSGLGYPVVSFPNMDRRAIPVEPHEVEAVELEDLTPRELDQYERAAMGMKSS